MVRLSFSAKQQRSSVQFLRESFTSNKITLYEELRLIERCENEIHSMWKGAHMMLFFLAFVFGSFCTCCFHMLMRMFDNKCVLFPRLVSHKSLRFIVFEFFSIKLEGGEDEPNMSPDFVSTKWSDNSVCYLPTYVPLMSGLGGLVWATMFLMCSHSATVNGPPRQWRALPFIFLFSVVMSGLCIYSSVITHTGLRELCTKLDEVTGSSMTTYTINVATLAYERRIRGVYQATHLTIASAWLHTLCWLMSTLLVLARVLLAVDFTLVTVKAQLVGGVDTMMQRFEDQINSISPDSPKFDEDESEVELYATNPKSRIKFRLSSAVGNVRKSDFSLVPEEKNRLTQFQYIEEILSDLVDNITKKNSSGLQSAAGMFDINSDQAKASSTKEFINVDKVTKEVMQHYKARNDTPKKMLDVEKITQEVMEHYKANLNEGLQEFEHELKSSLKIKSGKPNTERKHIRLQISDDNAYEEPPKYDKKDEEENSEKNEETDKINEKSEAASSKSTQKKKKDEHFDGTYSIRRELRILDDINTGNEKIDTAFEHAPFYGKIVEENKGTEPTEKELEKKDGTNENKSMDTDIVHDYKLPENEDIDKYLIKYNEENRNLEKKQEGKPSPKEKDDEQDGKTEEEHGKVKGKEKEDAKDDKDKEH